MKKLQIIAAGTLGTGAIIVSGLGVANAATSVNNKTSNNVGNSGIPRDVFKQERLDAEAHVLNTSTTSVEDAHKNKTFDTLLSKAGLSKSSFKDKLKTQLTADLKSKGYSQDQITIALQHRTIEHLHQKVKHDK